MARYAVVDLASAVPLRSRVVELRPPAATPLLDPDAYETLLVVGPWLVDLGIAPDIGDALRSTGAFRAWGYIIDADADLVTLRQHLRKFNTVQLDGGESVFFRYFDPRVLLEFAAFSTPEQFAQFMRPLNQIFCEDALDSRIVIVTSRGTH